MKRAKFAFATKKKKKHKKREKIKKECVFKCFSFSFSFLVFLLVVTPRCRREKAWGASELSPRGLHFQFLLQCK